MSLFLTFQIKVPKGIPAGGIRISVSGKNLAYIQNPQMYVYYKDKLFGSVSVPAACAVLFFVNKVQHSVSKFK
jgi:plexin A